MDYLLSRENDAHESAKMRVARSVAIVDISLIYYIYLVCQMQHKLLDTAMK